MLFLPGNKTCNMKQDSRQRTRYANLPLRLLVSSGHNPRKNVDPIYIRELAESLKRDGQWDPIIARKRNNGRYELIAGECRLRAAKLAGLKTLKARVLESNDVESLILALKTNILRKDLNPVEEGNALRELVSIEKDLKNLTKELSKSKTWVSNRLKLAERATEGVKNAVLKEELSLLSAIKTAELDEGLQGPVASKVIRERLSFREVEKLVELFKKAGDDSEIETLLRTPVKDYMRAAPYGYDRSSVLRSKRTKPMLMRCDCGTVYIIDWAGCRIVSEKGTNHERNNNIENNPEILK
jgi:ParB family chromosome partitioning protein